MAKSSKLLVARGRKILLVRRRADGRWALPGGRSRPRETDKDCLRREIGEELPKLKLRRLQLWKKMKAGNAQQAIFVVRRAKGRLVIGDSKELDNTLAQALRCPSD
jgi:8-oxo-dGTP diphosphatase